MISLFQILSLYSAVTLCYSVNSNPDKLHLSDQAVNKLLNEEINPVLLKDGGECSLNKIENGHVFLQVDSVLIIIF